MNLALLGGPGSGKGTQAEFLAREFGIPHIASGDLFRENINHHTSLGKKARGFMNRGELVPDEITDAMVEERLARPDTADGFILDGFPRTVSQAEALCEFLAKSRRPQIRAIYIRVRDDELVRRLSGRWICGKCQAPYHTWFKPPRLHGVCDQCGGALCQRDDDKPETVRVRLKTFHQQTEPLAAYYERAGRLQPIDGEGGLPDVTRRLRDAVRDLRGWTTAGEAALIAS